MKLRNPKLVETQHKVKSVEDARRTIDGHVIQYEKECGGYYRFFIETKIGTMPEYPQECQKQDIRTRQF